MAKILATKGKEYIPAQSYFVNDESRDFHTKYGIIKSADLKKPDGTKVKSTTDKEYFVFSPKFIDLYKRIRRYAQTIPLKDIGFILATTGIGKDSIVLEAGGGSGGFSCFISRFVKKVISYDIEDKSIEMMNENIKNLEIKNIKIKKLNIYEKIDDKNVDLVLLDLPEPWQAVENADKALNAAGFLVIYTPTINQMQQAMNKIAEFEGLMPVKTVELVERGWKVAGQVVRPTSRSNIHSGFISFVRKISK
jgi:tRNA (adenine57-N1/adenine58-N1)-methyltransferase